MKSKPSIVCLVTNDLMTDQRMQRICQSLSSQGYAVTLVGRILPNSPELEKQNFTQVRLKCRFNKGFLFYAEFNVRLLLFILKNRFSIVCAIDLDTIVAGYLGAKLTRSISVYDAHEWFPECPEIVQRPKIHAFWTAIERFFVPRMDAVYTVSQAIADVFKEKYRTTVDVVRNMPLPKDGDAFAQEGFILYQGALNIGRGLPEMISAMQFIDRKLILAGAGDIEEELKELITTLDLHHKVQLVGRVQPSELKFLTAKAWLGLNLLENLGYNYYYSLANKFFDYVQAGVPQICIDFPEYKALNTAEEVAVLVPDLEVQTLVNAVKFLEENQDIYNQLQSNCRKASKMWTWEQEELKLLAIYEKLGG